MAEYKKDILFSVTKLGKVKTWEISVKEYSNESVIASISGYVDGKKTLYESTIKKGKNIGKANETTHFTQAKSEADSKWNKKIDSGYTINPIYVKNNDIIMPMLALDYKNRSHDIVFPCYVQPKIDGFRAILQEIGSGKALLSRKSKQFLNVKHITDELANCKFNLDGEIYSAELPERLKTTINHKTKSHANLALTFQEMNGLIKKKYVTEDDTKLSLNFVYIIYDVVIENVTYEERLKILQDFFKENKFKYIKLLESYNCKDTESLMKYNKQFLKDEYEGTIIRNKKGLYKQKYRSKDLQKFKMFMDKEFEIIGFTDGEGTEKGLIIWKCKTESELEFDVRPKGNFKERRELFKNGKKYIGKMLTVKYFDYSDNGTPIILTTLYGGEADIRSLQL